MDGHRSALMVNVLGYCSISLTDHQIEPTLINLALNNTVEAIFTSASPWDTSCEAPTRSEL